MVVIFTRDYYVGHAEDDEDEFEDKMSDILGADDVNKFHDYISDGFHEACHYPALLDMCLRAQARNCTLHMIQGKLPHGPPFLSTDHVPPVPRLPVLYRVIYFMCEPQVFHLLLTNCKAANQVNKLLEHLHLLHWLLDLLVQEPPLSDWSPGKPLSTLIHSLSLPQFTPKLDSARLLAQHTHSIDQIALGYILNEEIMHLAALLLVAPFTSRDLETIKPYANLESIVSQATHGQSVTPATFCAAALLYIFENNGYKLTSQFDNPQKGSAQPAEGEQSFVNRHILQPQEWLVQVSKGVRSFSSIQQTDKKAMVNEMTCREDADEVCELFDPDANLSFENYPSLLHSLLKENEGNVTFQLLQANLSRINEELLHSQGGLPALISAIHTFCNNNDDAMEHFKSRDARHVNLTYTCLLHFVLSSVVKYDHLSKWSPGQSLVKLILLLFLQRELRPTLKCAQLIAERINSVNEVAWKLIQQGELIQLAGLLLVARKKAMEPFDSGDTVKKTTSMENVVSRVLRGESVTATMGAAGLIEIFEKAGDALAKYWSIHNDEHEPVGVIVEVATIIQHSGIEVLSTDVDLTDIYNLTDLYYNSRWNKLKNFFGIYNSHPKMLKSICERLGIKIGDTSGLSSQISRKSPFPSVKSVEESYQPLQKWCPYRRHDTTESLETVPRLQAPDNLGSRAFSTSSRIVDRVRRGTLKQSSASASASPSPLARDLAYLAMKLKRGVRLVW